MQKKSKLYKFRLKREEEERDKLYNNSKVFFETLININLYFLSSPLIKLFKFKFEVNIFALNHII